MLPRRLFFFAISCALALGAQAAALLAPPEVTPASPTSVTVRWRTDVPTGTRVRYGPGADRLNESAEGVVTDAHEVTLSGLQTGTAYFFAVGTARKQLATGQFTTSSSPVSSAAPVSTSPAAAPAAVPKPRSLLAKIIAPFAALTATSPGALPAPANAPPTRQTWGNPGSLPDHFARHGADFGATSPDDYAARAWQFRQRMRAGTVLVKVDEDGVQRVFDPASGAFAAYNRNGTTKTFFKPGSRDYFNRQPGRLVSAAQP